ncbi:MAG: demethoxyubiquinone hydroxylase family protein [Myxococcaceae bacterium]|nr:demethoxyubiquinone hydroxylase family protein [Myxococcaceae bacterium]
MPQTPPFHALTPDRKLSDTELARAIRLDMEAELDAINLYASHLDATDNEEAKAIIRHVMNEEKEHAALFYRLLRRLDGTQEEHESEVEEKYRLIVSGASDEEVEAVGKKGGAQKTASESSAVKSLTVGPLRGR